MSKYNGHANYNAWNISLWLKNDEGLYSMAKEAIRSMPTKDLAAESLLCTLNDCGVTHTPDGVKYTKSNLRRAMVGL